jgi:putative peptidoglycan lipid II flippase
MLQEPVETMSASGKTGGLLKNTFTVGAFTALSRVLGLVREMLQSRIVGAGMEQSAFTLAFAIPNMARKLFGEGALTAAFVPVFAKTLRGDEMSGDPARRLEAAARLARSVMTMVLLMLGSIVLLAMGGLEIVIKFREELGLQDQERLKLTIRLVKTLLPYMIFICGAAFGMGVLNSLGRFKASSFMPCLLNICWIGMLAWISFFPEMRLDQRIHRIAMAILAAGAAQMLFLFWRMHVAGITPRLSFTGWANEKVRLVWRNLGVAALGAGAVQLNYLLDQLLAYCASPWAAGVIGYAERLMDLPLGVIGVAFGTVLLPTFAGLFAKGDEDGARNALASGVQSLMFVMFPASVGLFVLAPEVTSVIYEGGAFGAEATVRVSRALAVYAFGLCFFGFTKSMVPWFQAQNDMKTPLRVSLVTVVVNAVLNVAAVLLLPEEWRHVGLAASTVVCAVIGCVLLVAFARRKNGRLGLSSCAAALASMLAASLLMGVVLYFMRPMFAGVNRVLSLCAMVASGMLVYAIASVALLRGQVKTLLRRRRSS